MEHLQFLCALVLLSCFVGECSPFQLSASKILEIQKKLSPTEIRKSNTKTLKALERISNHLSYTVYSNEIDKGYASYTLDPSQASLALEWKKTVRKNKRMIKASRKSHQVNDDKKEETIKKEETKQEETKKEETNEKESSNSSRIKRGIFGHDTRAILLSPAQKRMFPFNAVVNVYPGCTGTVIGRRYVLTAAECIHDGETLLNKVDKLRVGHYNQRVSYNPYEDQGSHDSAVKWYRVDKVFVPNGWRWRLDQDRYNYAVLRIAQPGHFNSCMGVEGEANLPVTTKRSRLHFSSFEEFYHRGDPLLMYRYCHMEKTSSLYVYERCDSTPAARGAGLYFRFWQGAHRNWDRKIIAVKSNRRQQLEVKGGLLDDTITVGTDMRITPLVFAQICFWVSEEPTTCGKGYISDPCLEETYA